MLYLPTVEPPQLLTNPSAVPVIYFQVIPFSVGFEIYLNAYLVFRFF